MNVELEDNNITNEVNEINTSNVTNTNTNTSNNTKPKKADAPYYIKVNYQANVVTVYKKDKSGEYTVPMKAMVCSSGSATPTSGVYGITDKYTWRLLEGNVYGQYACRITGSILFHSVPYEKKDKSKLEWWEYDKLGTTASLGCIRLKVEDAKWIYDNCIPGTKVEFYASEQPGPLGKPTAKKITNDEAVRNWDPTDPDKNNPWIEYIKKQNENESAEKPKEENAGNNNQNKVSNITEDTTTKNIVENKADLDNKTKVQEDTNKNDVKN